jgi:hypothetical protein
VNLAFTEVRSLVAEWIFIYNICLYLLWFVNLSIDLSLVAQSCMKQVPWDLVGIHVIYPTNSVSNILLIKSLLSLHFSS